MEGRVQALVAHSDAQVSRVVETVSQRLESEIQAAMTRTTATAMENTRTAIKEMQRDVQL